MKKRMFSKFTSILQHAVDALAPQLSLQEEFIYHWKAVTAFFIDNKGEKIPVEQTNIPAHLEQMLVILQQEETGSERGMYGPCLEYLLQHKLLDTLYSLGRTDYPLGMKQIVLSFFTKMLSRIKQPLLAHVNVYKAVQRLIKTCGEVKAGPAEIEEIQFLCTVCAKIKADPYLVSFFLEVPKSQPIHTPSGIKTPVMEEPTSENKLFQDFHLVSTLLNLSHSEDRRVAVKACEGLILCASLPDPVAAHCMINSTKFCDDLTERLISTYKQLPDVINPLELEHVQAKWGMEVVTEREDQQTFVGKRLLVSFLSWLDYCDQLSTIANPIVAEALARKIHQHFLQPLLKPALLQMSETGVITAMAYLTRCLYTVCSERLLSEFTLFILGDDRKAEVKGETADSLRSRLIEQCNSLSEEVCLVALQLFDALLQKDDEHILHNLVIRNIENRGYHDKTVKRDSNLVISGLLITEQESFKPENTPKDTTQDIDSSPDDSGLEICNSTEMKYEVQESQKKGESQSEVGFKSEAESQNEAGSQSETESQSEAGSQNEVKSSEGIKSLSGIDEIVTDTSCDLSGNTKIDENDGKKEESNNYNNESTLKDSESGIELNDEVEEIGKDNCDKDDDNVELEDTDIKEGECNKVNDNKDRFERESSVFKDMCSPESSPALTPAHTKTEVHKIVNSFLSLLPEELKSSNQTADSGYDMYLRDAHRQFAAMSELCKNWNYPKEITAESSDQDTYYEGSFLSMLLDKLSHILDQSYPINLQLTSVVSKLALVPHPCLHEFLLDPYCPLKHSTRNLFSIFQKVSNEIKSQFQSERDLAQKLLKVRKSLMGASSSAQRLEDQSRLEAIIVLEEFCKELSAIAFVKHHASVTEDRT